MDFMKLIKSLEQLLYELMVWVVFYPRTVFLAIFRPMELMKYATSELKDDDAERYSDTLSPPIFLAISLALVHLIELSHGQAQFDGLLGDDKNLLAFRLVAFSLFPLMLSIRLLRAQGITLDRNTLQGPFYAQCFIAAPFAFGIDEAIVAAGLGQTLLASILAAITLIWYVWIQTLWFRRALDVSHGRGLAMAIQAMLSATVCVLVFALAVMQL